ncbi:MAG: threonine synthase [Chloroflexota bacterium]
MSRPSLLRHYREFLPVGPKTPELTLGEGFTPLVRSRHLGPRLGLQNLYFKFEGANPTGSFKDRGMVVAVAKALEEGARGVVCASTGNTSASAAAYAAYAGLPAVVLVPAGGVAAGKLLQAVAYGAQVFEVRATFDRALEAAVRLATDAGLRLVNSLNPHRLAGQKTAAFEVVDELGDAPDYLFLPVGNAGNISAYWLGFKEYLAAGRSTKLPRLAGFQAAGAAPIVRGHPVPNPETVASAIQIGHPANWAAALQARDESGGIIEAVTDDEILAARRLLAELEGLFVEPASAAGVAGLVRFRRLIADPAAAVVCVLTGSGLKDPAPGFDLESRVRQVEELGEILKALDLEVLPRSSG